MKVSMRIGGRVTSVNIRDSICAMHYLLTCDNPNLPVRDHITDKVIDTILPQWKGLNGKGFSGFVQDTLIEDVLDQDDVEDFYLILKSLRYSLTEGHV